MISNYCKNALILLVDTKAAVESKAREQRMISKGVTTKEIVEGPEMKKDEAQVVCVFVSVCFARVRESGCGFEFGCCEYA